MIEISCGNCGKIIKKFPSRIPKSGRGYCSASCSTSYRNKYEYNPSHFRDLTGRNNPMFGKGYLISGNKNGNFGKVGELNVNWKGGKHMRNDGYFRVTVNKKRVLEHRKILSDAGFDITGKVVHHKNKNPSDNKLSNLQAITRQEHINIHRKDLINGRNP